ncbi:MAG: hypothetical protein GY851_04760 [bacterium]|nr:hypothetical protein [bacterium]
MALVSFLFVVMLWMTGSTIYPVAPYAMATLAATGLCMLIVLPVVLRNARRADASLWRFVQVTLGFGAMASIATGFIVMGDDLVIILTPCVTLPASVLAAYATIQHRHARRNQVTAS